MKASKKIVKMRYVESGTVQNNPCKVRSGCQQRSTKGKKEASVCAKYLFKNGEVLMI